MSLSFGDRLRSHATLNIPTVDLAFYSSICKKRRFLREFPETVTKLYKTGASLGLGGAIGVAVLQVRPG
mgnify:CR=1 FL=1